MHWLEGQEAATTIFHITNNILGANPMCIRRLVLISVTEQLFTSERTNVSSALTF